MEQQVLVAIDRESGSGGHEISRQLSSRLGLPLYDDENILAEIAKEQQVNAGTLLRYDEKPRNVAFSRSVKGFNNSSEFTLANMAFDLIRDRASCGHSFIVLGHCGAEILREHPSLISVFIQADKAFRLERIMLQEHLSESQAQARMTKADVQHSRYHNQFCKKKWGVANTYDLVINSARLGIAGTVDLLVSYSSARCSLFAEETC